MALKSYFCHQNGLLRIYPRFAELEFANPHPQSKPRDVARTAVPSRYYGMWYSRPGCI